MAKKKGKKKSGQVAHLSANIKTNAKKPKYVASIAPKAIAQTRKDIQSWKKAQQLAQLEENPKWYLIQHLFDDIMLDALLSSQYENRQLKALGERIVLRKPNGEIDEEQSHLLNNAVFTNEINKNILAIKSRKYSVIELSFNEEGMLQVDLVPRANIDPRDGVLYPDYTEDKKIYYRNTAEYGVTVLEFREKEGMGLLNKAVPHVLFKRFAQSCYSELCEIYGIPPRVMKTNTHDPSMVKRAESMMRDMGAAAWFIIDDSEEFEWAQGVSTNGDVYKNLMAICNNEISLLFSGAIIGQDTKNGSRSKDESAQEMLKTLIESDMRLLEKYWNTTVIPALVQLGILKGELTYEYEQHEDLKQLWDMTKEALPYYKVKPDWIKEKFGIEVEGNREAQPQNNLSLGADFFD